MSLEIFNILFESEDSDDLKSSQHMTIDGSGNIGIGTVSPGVKLEVIGSVSASIASTGSFGMAKLGDTTYPSLTFPANHNADKIRLYDGGSEKIGTSAHTMILTAASHSFVGTNGTTKFSMGYQGEVKVSGSILPTGDNK